MSEPINPPYPQERTPEQHAAVRRRAFPIAACGALFGVGALILLVMRQVDYATPPNLLAVNLSFCALMMGVGILFYARGTSGTGTAAAASALAIITGLIGVPLFAVQSVHWHGAVEDRELDNVHLIATAALKYAQDHEGKFPQNLDVLVDEKRLAAESLRSPFGSEDAVTKRKTLSDAEFKAWFDRHSDYDYLGEDVKIPLSAPPPAAIIIVASKTAVMHEKLAIAFADGRSEFIDAETKDPVVKASDEARVALHLPLAKLPPIFSSDNPAETQP